MDSNWRQVECRYCEQEVHRWDDLEACGCGAVYHVDCMAELGPLGALLGACAAEHPQAAPFLRLRRAPSRQGLLMTLWKRAKRLAS